MINLWFGNKFESIISLSISKFLLWPFSLRNIVMKFINVWIITKAWIGAIIAKKYLKWKRLTPFKWIICVFTGLNVRWIEWVNSFAYKFFSLKLTSIVSEIEEKGQIMLEVVRVAWKKKIFALFDVSQTRGLSTWQIWEIWNKIYTIILTINHFSSHCLFVFNPCCRLCTLLCVLL